MSNVAASSRASWPRASAGVVCVLLVVFAAGCRSVPPTVKIGLVAPFEGRWRDVGYDAIYAARLAVREVNENGGVAGYRVELVALDDRGDPQLAAEAAATLAADPALIVAMGHWLPHTTSAVAPVYADLG
ncbi:MAG: ABC transporter substrate-binding protein, partial [Anaerolineae bacterium]|nr:ABC transporter substrate-binding protein [Anaerolineae bacterium]